MIYLKNKWAVLISSVILFIGILLIISYFKLTSHVKEELQNNVPRTYALEMARSNQVLKGLLGDSIRIDSLNKQPKREAQMRLSLDTEGIQFSANAVDLEIPLIAKKAKAILFVTAEKRGDEWIYDKLEVKVVNPDTLLFLK